MSLTLTENVSVNVKLLVPRWLGSGPSDWLTLSDLANPAIVRNPLSALKWDDFALGGYVIIVSSGPKRSYLSNLGGG